MTAGLYPYSCEHVSTLHQALACTGFFWLWQQCKSLAHTILYKGGRCNWLQTLKHQQMVLPASPAGSSSMLRTSFQGSTQVSPVMAWLQSQLFFYMPELLSQSTYQRVVLTVTCVPPHAEHRAGCGNECDEPSLRKWLCTGKKSNPQHNFWHSRQFRKCVTLLIVYSLAGFYFYSCFLTSSCPNLFLSFLGMTHPIFSCGNWKLYIEKTFHIFWVIPIE